VIHKAHIDDMIKDTQRVKTVRDPDNGNRYPAALWWSLLVIIIGMVAIGPNPAYSEEITDPETQSSTKPLWELGLFGGITRLPLYLGSSTHRTYALPLPYLIYRGKLFQSDREGVRGIFSRSEYLETTLSFFGNPPASEDGTAREGMGDLDPIIEAGPALKWYFLGRRPNQYLYLQPALRWVTSVGLPDNVKFRYRGWRFLVNLIYQNDAVWGNDQWGMGWNLGINSANHQYNGYFYDVAEEDVLPGRPAFEAEGGYGGMMLSGNVIYRLNRSVSFAAYGRWDGLAGAIYRDSPLVEQDNNFTVAAALIWTVATSKKQVDARYQEK